MSFEVFNPSNKEFLVQQEDAAYKAPEIGINGADVGGNTPQDTKDTNEKIDAKKENIAKKPVPTIEEMTAKNNTDKMALSRAVQDNPDWPPKSENPESAAAEVSKLESSFETLA